MSSFMTRLKSSYNVLLGKQPEVGSDEMVTSLSPSSAYYIARRDTTRAVLAPIKTRIAIDSANIPMRHVMVDEFHKFLSVRTSELNDRLSVMANIDQPATAFIQDAVMTMLEVGSCVLVPIEISGNPESGTYDILSLRVGTVVEWFNKSVTVEVYNELTGDRTQRTLPKAYVSICYNPMYAVMNEANSTLNRLIDKLALLDVADGKLFSPQLDLILQLPFTLKSEKREAEAERRLQALENQLYDRKYGVGYIDATEKVTQLNRPVTNALFETVKALTESLHSQLGLTPAIFSGTASQEEMLAYNNRTILPILKALTESMIGAFFSRTAIRQGNSIMAFPSLFKMAPLEIVAEAADKLTRNAILSSNEVRSEIGYQASKQADSDELRNKNLNKSDNVSGEEPQEQPASDDEDDSKEN